MKRNMSRIFDWRRRRVEALLLTVCLGPLLAGCDASVGMTSRSHSHSDADATPGNSTAKDYVELRHDFGIVKTSAQLRHVFRIENESDLPWTLKKVHTSCSCTVGTISSDIIDPGATESIEVEYSAPKGVADESRVMLVEFNEPTAPIVRLTVTAKPRLPVSVIPQSLELGSLSNIEAAIEVPLQVHNYSSNDWRGIDCNIDWGVVHARQLKVAASRDPGGRRQIWQVLVTLRPKELAPGTHKGSLVLSPIGCEETADVPVSFSVAAPVASIPSSFFFGPLLPTEKQTREISVSFASSEKSGWRDRVRLDWEPKDLLTAKWAVREGNVWRLQATFRAPSMPGTTKGRVRVSMEPSDDSEAYVCEIPVVAIVSATQSEEVSDDEQ